MSEQRFVDYAWRRFDPDRVLSILMSQEDSFYAHKKILFSGFSIWVACPSQTALIKDIIALQTAATLHAAEKKMRSKFKKKTFGDMYVRAAMSNEFFHRIYYPIGGLGTLLRVSSAKDFESKLRKQTENVQHVLRLIEIFHYHVDYLLEAKSFGIPSIKKGSDIVWKLNTTDGTINNAPRQRQMQKHWSSHRASAAFLYAANRLRISDDEFLLDRILRGVAYYHDVKGFLPEWFGRTRFVMEHIFKRCDEDLSIAEVSLSSVEPKSFAAPDFDEEDRRLIADLFENKRVSKQRQNETRESVTQGE